MVPTTAEPRPAEQVMMPVAATMVQSPDIVKPRKDPELLYGIWPLVPPGVPPPPPLLCTKRVLAQALEISPAGRSEQVVFCASASSDHKPTIDSTGNANSAVTDNARKSFLNIAFHHG